MPVDLGDDDNVEVQMAPLIDCVFLLLIFFLVATTMKKIEKELPLDLPEAGAAIEVPTERNLFIISVDREGRMYLGSEPVGMEIIHGKLREIAATNPMRRIRIDADRMTPFQSIIHVLDICNYEGLKNVGLHTAPNRKR